MSLFVVDGDEFVLCSSGLMVVVDLVVAIDEAKKINNVECITISLQMNMNIS